MFSGNQSPMLNQLRLVAGLVAAAIVTIAWLTAEHRPIAALIDSSGKTAVTLESVEQSAPENVPSALRDLTAAGLPKPLIDPGRVLSGGPPPDGIPPIDAPKFQLAADVDWLADAEAVVSLTVGGQTRAYPIQVLTWHEIVNDTIAGTPATVTYCPLCNTAIAFNRRVGDRVVTFGTSGKLYLSNLVMYDRQTQSLWPQIQGRAVAGALTGTTLKILPTDILPWRQWREDNPDSQVLSRDTGFTRDYGRNPYVGYDEPQSQPFALDTDTDPRLPAKERIVAFPAARQATAVTLTDLAAAGSLALTVDEQPVVLFAAPGLASSLDSASIAEGKPITSTRAFLSTTEAQALTFRKDGDDFLDSQTGSRWTINGKATRGPLRGRQLTPIAHIDTFWFAWAAFRPDTRIIN